MSFRLLTLIVALAAGTAGAEPFFPFCIDWQDAKHRTFDEQAVMLKELGYDGVGHIWLDKVEERIKSLDAVGLKLFQITMKVDVAANKPPYDRDRFKQVLSLVKGRNVQFLLIFSGAPPAAASANARGVAIIREMSDLARESGSQLLLYPHTGNWIERIEDAVRIADQVDRPNVGVMFNLCHWLRVDKSRDYEPLLRQAMPRLWAVSINGADEHDDKPGWGRYIQPLDSGNFDVATFLKTLCGLGYKGPIGLQCYGIGGDAREHLARSISAWRKMSGATEKISTVKTSTEKTSTGETATAKRAVILDTDIGDDIDDTWALAMLLKSPELDLKLVTTTCGKAEYRAKLVAKLLTVAGRGDIPIGLGEGGHSGAGGQEAWVKDYKLSDYQGTVHSNGAAAIIDMIEASQKPFTVISIGPSHTLAAALKARPAIASKAFFVGMQGSVFKGYDGGPVSPEYNVKANVAAAKTVLSATVEKN